MYPKKERVLSLLDAAIKEMNLLLEMSKDINVPELLKVSNDIHQNIISGTLDSSLSD